MPSHIFYEVKDKQGSQWGGEDAWGAMMFWRTNTHQSIWASEWEGDGEDLWQTTKAIDITPIALSILHHTKIRPML